jgi:energy-coupling factor transporter ATP-binding protein EcfA2
MSTTSQVTDRHPAAFTIHAPYPGLRPFQPDESPIFFGRDEHVADMLTILENHRFLAVVGPSGSGKSSLVLAGLIPALARGDLLTTTSKDWRFLLMRPGDAPYHNLANALQTRLWSDHGAHQFHDGDATLTELVLRGSPFGIVETLRDAALPPNANVLLLVDQFEELFRFRSQESGGDAAVARRRDDAAIFVRLLLETVKQARYPVYVMLTMRTDFLGDCDVFDGLPQAINQSQYLTPRLNLQQLSEAIVKPLQLSLFRGSVAPEVVQRIINDVGTERDELPIVQHALFRTWQERKRLHPDEPVRLDLGEYEAVGGLKNALSRHADEALSEMIERGQERLVKKVFVALCARSANGQQVRRPVTIGQIADEAGYSMDEVMSVADAFRRGDRCFLMPPSDQELSPETKIDISHESLLREWKTLKKWVEEEAHSAATFIRLRDAAVRWPTEEGLLRDPALSIALDWSHGAQPSEPWAARYGGELNRVLEYLRESEQERERVRRAEEEAQQRELQQEKAARARLRRNWIQWASIAAASCLAIVGWLGFASAKAARNELAAQKEAITAQQARIAAQNDLEREKQTFKNVEQRVAPYALENHEPLSGQDVLHRFEAQARLSAIATQATPQERSRVTVEYFAKPSDSERLKAGLNSLGFQIKTTAAINPNPTNVVWYGSQVAENDVKIVALAMIRSGVTLQGVQPFQKSTTKPLTIQVGHEPRIEDLPPLTTDAIATQSLTALTRPYAPARDNVQGVVIDFDPTTHQGTIASTTIPSEKSIFFKTRPEVPPFKKGDQVIFMLVSGPNRHYATGVTLVTAVQIAEMTSVLVAGH